MVGVDCLARHAFLLNSGHPFLRRTQPKQTFCKGPLALLGCRMRNCLFLSAMLTFSAALPQSAIAQPCTPYKVGGFTLGEAAPLENPSKLSCVKRDSNSKCLLRKHKFSKNGFKYEVLLTADAFHVADIVGENKDLTGNDEDFQYFAKLMTEKYSTPDSSGQFYTYYYPESTNPFGSGLKRKYVKDKKVAESWQNHVCWGECSTKSFDIDGPRSSEMVNYRGKTIKSWSIVHAQGKVLDPNASSGLFLNMGRTATKQNMTIKAECSALKGEIERKSISNNRTGEF